MSQFTLEMYLLLSLPAFFVGLSREGLGGGFALAAAILSAQIFEPIKAAAFLLPLLIISDPLSVWIYRKNIYWNSIKILLPGIILGVVLTFFLINKISSSVISIIVGFLGIFLAIDGLTRKFVKAPKKILPPYSWCFPWCYRRVFKLCNSLRLAPNCCLPITVKINKTKIYGNCCAYFCYNKYCKTLPIFFIGAL